MSQVLLFSTCVTLLRANFLCVPSTKKNLCVRVCLSGYNTILLLEFQTSDRLSTLLLFRGRLVFFQRVFPFAAHVKA